MVNNFLQIAQIDIDTARRGSLGEYILTVSRNLLLLPEATESLAGRTVAGSEIDLAIEPRLDCSQLKSIY